MNIKLHFLILSIFPTVLISTQFALLNNSKNFLTQQVSPFCKDTFNNHPIAVGLGVTALSCATTYYLQKKYSPYSKQATAIKTLGYSSALIGLGWTGLKVLEHLQPQNSIIQEFHKTSYTQLVFLTGIGVLTLHAFFQPQKPIYSILERNMNIDNNQLTIALNDLLKSINPESFLNRYEITFNNFWFQAQELNNQENKEKETVIFTLFLKKSSQEDRLEFEDENNKSYNLSECIKKIQESLKEEKEICFIIKYYNDCKFLVKIQNTNNMNISKI